MLTGILSKSKSSIIDYHYRSPIYSMKTVGENLITTGDDDGTVKVMNDQLC